MALINDTKKAAKLPKATQKACIVLFVFSPDIYLLLFPLNTIFSKARRKYRQSVAIGCFR